MSIRRFQLYQALRPVARRHLRGPTQGLRYGKLAFTKQLITLPLAQITDEFGFSLQPGGWNFYCSLLTDYDRCPGRPLEDTVFFRFFTHHRLKGIRSLNELLFLHRPSMAAAHDFHFYLGTYPWGGLTPRSSLQGGEPFGWYYDQQENAATEELWGRGRNLWYNPGDKYTIEHERDLTLQLYSILQQNGYNPWRYLSFPSVSLLIHRDGRAKGLIMNGHHRLAILRHLGYEAVRVEITQTVKDVEARDWFYVRNGDCSMDEALRIFEAFFQLSGSERLKYLELYEHGRTQ